MSEALHPSLDLKTEALRTPFGAILLGLTPDPTIQSLNPTPQPRNLKPETLLPDPDTLAPKSETRNLKTLCPGGERRGTAKKVARRPWSRHSPTLGGALFLIGEVPL